MFTNHRLSVLILTFYIRLLLMVALLIMGLGGNPAQANQIISQEPAVSVGSVNGLSEVEPSLQWHTFMGSSSDWDYGFSITVDGSGNVYVTGTSFATWGSPINPHTGVENAFVAKLSSDGTRQWGRLRTLSKLLPPATRVSLTTTIVRQV